MTCKCTPPKPRFADAFNAEAGIVCAVCGKILDFNMPNYEAAMKRAEIEVFKKIKK